MLKIFLNYRTKTGADGVAQGKTLDEIEEKKVRDLEETIRMKNKQIQSLLEDIDQVEKESVDYQNRGNLKLNKKNSLNRR